MRRARARAQAQRHFGGFRMFVAHCELWMTKRSLVITLLGRRHSRLACPREMSREILAPAHSDDATAGVLGSEGERLGRIRDQLRRLGYAGQTGW
jgi:hypothetical protein